MTTKEVDHSKQVTVGSEVDGSLLDRVTKFQKDIDERNNSNVNVTEEVKKPKGSTEGADNPPVVEEEEEEEGPNAGKTEDPNAGLPDENKAELPIAEFLETNKTSKQELFNKLLEDPETSLTIKNKRGKEVKTNYGDLKADIERGRLSQAKLDKMANSEELEFGTIMAAAKSGDKEAQKKALNMLKEFSGKEDIDGFVDDVEEFKGDFDSKLAREKQQRDASWDEYFPEALKNSVDYEDNLLRMDSVLKGQIPGKVYEFYMNRPETKRIMYELVAQDKAQVALDAFFEKYDSLSSVEQIRIDSDPAAWGTAFNASFESLKRRNAKSASKKVESEESSSEHMDSVSAGSGGRTRTPAPAKSFLKMSSKDFAAEKKRLLSGG